jgi:hypothetical protein
MMRLAAFILFFYPAIFCQAQLQSFEITSPMNPTGGIVRFNNYAALGQKNNDKVDYSEVRGNCFWESEWNPAILIVKGGKAFKLQSAKLNLYTNDIHYLDNKGNELVAQNKVQNIVFYDRKDTTKLKAVFQHLAGFKIKDTDFYAQLLVEGKTQFFKRKEVKLSKSKDVMLDHPDLRFNSEVHYYIEENGNLTLLKSISKENLFSIINAREEDEDWLKVNKNKLKNETDVIAFLTHRNSIKK